MTRVAFAIFAFITIVIGLVVHTWGAPLGVTARDALGDALWAAMIAWLVGAMAPRARLASRCAVAYAICAAVETSQLYHSPTLDAMRETQLGQLVLGSGFDVRDLAAYAAGVAAAALIEIAVSLRGREPAR